MNLSNVNAFDDGETPIMRAAWNNSYLRAAFLIRSGANIYLRDKFGKSALYWVGNINNVSIDLVRVFIKKVANDCSYDKVKIVEKLIAEKWPLQKIVLIRDVEMTKIALERYYKKYIDAEDFASRTALCVAIENIDVNNFKLLLEYKANVSKRMVKKEILDLQKVEKDYFYGKEKIVKKLIEAKWPLQTIVRVEDVGLTKMALDLYYNTYVNEKGCLNCIALHIAIENVDIEHVKLLLNYNADVNAVDRSLQTSLSYIYTSNNCRPENSSRQIQILQILLDNKSDSKHKKIDNLKDIENFLKYANTEAIKILMKYGMDLSNFNPRQNNVMHYVVCNENPGVIELLYDKNLNIDACNEIGCTPLSIAAYIGNVTAIEFLLNHGANIEAKGLLVCTPLYYAVTQYSESKGRYKDCVLILLGRGANAEMYWESWFKNFQTKFQSSLKESYIPIIQIVLEHIALQNSNGTSITEEVRNLINSQNEWKDHLESSKKHLSIKVHESLTLHDMFIKTDKDFERYARNEEARLKIQNSIKELSNFYFFSTTLEKRISKAIQIVTLRREAAYVIGRIMKMNYERFPLIADNIVSYLDTQSMTNLIAMSVKETTAK